MNHRLRSDDDQRAHRTLDVRPGEKQLIMMPADSTPAGPLVFQLEVPIRWGDMDAMGHVNNTLYFRFMEVIRIAWFDAMGIGPNPGGEGPVIINAWCTFVRELVYPGSVLCRHYVGQFGRSSCETWVEMSRTDDPDTLYARGGAKLVWVDYPQRKSAPIPEAVRVAMSTPR